MKVLPPLFFFMCLKAQDFAPAGAGRGSHTCGYGQGLSARPCILRGMRLEYGAKDSLWEYWNVVRCYLR